MALQRAMQEDRSFQCEIVDFIKNKSGLVRPEPRGDSRKETLERFSQPDLTKPD